LDFRAREDDEDVEERVIQTLRAKTSQNSLKLASLFFDHKKMSPLVVASFRALSRGFEVFFGRSVSRVYCDTRDTDLKELEGSL
jgi:exonuclease V gamma subunit